MFMPDDQQSVSHESDNQKEDIASWQEPKTKGEEKDQSNLATELAAERQKNKSLHDKYIRLQAELENFKKRIERDKCEFYKYAIEKLIKDFLPVLDHLELAIKSAKESKDFDSFSEGVELIYKQLKEILEKEGLNYVCSEGTKFDPCKHEAVMHIESEHHGKNIIIKEHKKGYFLKDRLLRPAMVTVAKEQEGKKDAKVYDKKNVNRREE